MQSQLVGSSLISFNNLLTLSPKTVAIGMGTNQISQAIAEHMSCQKDLKTRTIYNIGALVLGGVLLVIFSRPIALFTGAYLSSSSIFTLELISGAFKVTGCVLCHLIGPAFNQTHAPARFTLACAQGEHEKEGTSRFTPPPPQEDEAPQQHGPSHAAPSTLDGGIRDQHIQEGREEKRTSRSTSPTPSEDETLHLENIFSP